VRQLCRHPLGIYNKGLSVKSLLFTFVLLFFVQHSISQTHQFYFAFGYNYPTATNSVGYDNSIGNYYTTINGSFAKGPNIQLGYSFFITDNIGLDINYNYLIGFRDERLAPQTVHNYTEYDNRASSIIPSVIMKTNLGNLSLYIKFGPSISFVKLRIKQYRFPPYSKSESVLENDYSIGFSSSIGIDCRLTQSFYLFTDLHLNSLTYYPTKDSYYENGVLISSGSNQNDVAYPFSSLGLSFGVKLEL
jgi:hypothetical protein